MVAFFLIIRHGLHGLSVKDAQSTDKKLGEKWRREESIEGKLLVR